MVAKRLEVVAFVLYPAGLDQDWDLRVWGRAVPTLWGGQYCSCLGYSAKGPKPTAELEFSEAHVYQAFRHGLVSEPCEQVLSISCWNISFHGLHAAFL